MSEENSHSNPWADKLKRLAVPDVNDNWNNMQALLDKEMPISRKNSNLKGILLLLLLLLIIGVCNCPRLYRGNKTGRNDVTNTTITKPKRQTATKHAKDTLTSMPADKIFQKNKQHPNKMSPDPNVDNRVKMTDIETSMPGTKQQDITGHSNNVDGRPSLSSRRQNNTSLPTIYTYKRRNAAKARTVYKNGWTKRLQDNSYGARPKKEIGFIKKQMRSNYESRIKKEEQNGKRANDNDSLAAINKTIDTSKTTSIIPRQDSSTTTKQENRTDTLKTLDSLLLKVTPVATVDSTHKLKERGFAIAIGLNQFFAIGKQEHSLYNSNGTSGVLADYIPVPQIRYHFNKKLYMQGEAQFNAPQYTGTILARQSPPDSAIQRPPLQRSVYIKKLFYFNVPFSIHYSPAKNIYLGTGLQFSHLKNAVGLYENKRVGSTSQDTSNTAKFQTLKSDDTTYSLLRTNEWRFLLDANYHWKRLTLGLRYNQAFNYFINARISNTEITQARNNSLQLYLRYDIWDGRKKPVSGYQEKN